MCRRGAGDSSPTLLAAACGSRSASGTIRNRVRSTTRTCPYGLVDLKGSVSGSFVTTGRGTATVALKGTQLSSTDGQPATVPLHCGH